MNFYHNTILETLFGTVLLILCSCSGSSDDIKVNDPVRYSVIMKGMSFSDSSSADEEVSEVTAFQFSDGLLYREQILNPDQNGRAEISILADTRMYFIANASLDAQEKVTEEVDFSKSVIESMPGENSAPCFLSAVEELKAADETGNRETTVAMKHGVARIDLNIASDDKILINEITIDDAPAATYAFVEKSKVSDNTVSYKKQYSPAFNGKDIAAFYIFESTRPVTATLRGTYNDIPVRINIEIPVVDRNKVYELEVVNIGAKLEGIFEIKDWEEGETVIGKPDTDRCISISSEYSVLPEGVSVDCDNNVVNVPASGVEGLRLAFAADTRIDIARVDGLSAGVVVGDMTVEENSQNIVSMFDVSVPGQTNGRLGYSVFVHLKNALLSDSYDFVEIKVAPSDHQIETVEIGGCVWMAFNASSSDLDDQIYTLDGLSVEEMYKYNWINTVGGLFQFGRKYKYIPWMGDGKPNNLGDQAQDIPWQSASHMPCPEGYRLPTREELESLLPKGQTVPGSYKAGNGERIVATLHTAEGVLVTPTGVTGTQRYVKFTSEDTGRFLIIPLAGGKGDKSTSNNPGFGRRIVLWTNSNSGCPGGYALAYWLKFENEESTTITEERLQMEAFASVRCVKVQ